MSYVKGQVVVGFKPSVTEQQAKNIITVTYKLKWLSENWGIKEAVVGVPTGTEQQWVNKLKQNTYVKYAELNYTTTPA